MRHMMNYHCLRVFRSRVKRIGKPCTSPVFLCSEPESMAVPMLSCAVFRSRPPSRRFFFLAVSISHYTQVVNEASEDSVLSPFLTGRMFVRPNILRTLRRTMVRFLIELLLRRIWFGQSKFYFILNWLVMRCKLRPELAADAQQTA